MAAAATIDPKRRRDVVSGNGSGWLAKFPDPRLKNAMADAAIDPKRLPCHVSRRFGRQEQNRIADGTGFGVAPQRDVSCALGDKLGIRPLVPCHVCRDRARCDAVHADAAPAELDGQLPDATLLRRFARSVRKRSWINQAHRRGADGDDRRGVRIKAVQQSLHREYEREHVHLEGCRHGTGEALVSNCCAAGHAGAVHEAVQGGRGAATCLGNGIRARQVHLAIGKPVQLWGWLDVPYCQFMTARSRFAADLKADSRRSAGHNLLRHDNLPHGAVRDINPHDRSANDPLPWKLRLLAMAESSVMTPRGTVC
jgi:hypothetical protein